MDEMLKRVAELTDEEIEQYSHNLMPNVAPANGWRIKSAKGCTVEMEDGKKCLDLISAFFTNLIGFGDGEIARVIAEQAENVTYLGQMTNTKLRYALAHKLASIAPGDLNRVCFSVGGGAAMENACKLALKNRPGAMNFLVLWDSYHGNTFFSGAGSICATMNGGYTNAPDDPRNPDRAFWQYASSINMNFTRVPNPYCYRCPFRQKRGSCDVLCAEWVRYTIEKGVIGPAAALIVEPVQSGGAQMPLPVEYLQRVREICDEYGVLLIYDEVQTYARSGSFFAAEHYGVLPDILFSGKGIGGNMPVSVVIASDSLRPFDRGYEELNTQTNNQVSMAASLKSIEIIERDNLLKRGVDMGARFADGFTQMQKKYPKIGDIRALGCMVGVELVEDPVTKEPLDKNKMQKIRAKAEEMGLIFQYARECVIKIKPALIISEAEVDFALDVFERLFDEFLTDR